MANNIKITVKVDDDGTLKLVARDATKAKAGLDGVSNSARQADRNLKGAAQASSNGSKNFSKMAQGMTGGLVPAYASVAAQVFALTAAFDFLKNAADVQNLIAGQTQFANSTGMALQSVSSKLQDASQGMLSFKEAAQSAAIGAAKGFSTAQLEALAIGAGKAATALGRNYTDSYDRLIRGVSKAEPELLDELGITLKLEEAKRKYAKSIGVSADALTAAQSSQAVYVETMAQLNNQFGQIENRPNPFIQLQTTFGEIAKDVLTKIMPAFTAIADFLNNNAKAAAVVFAGVLGMVLLNVAGLTEGIGKVGAKISSVFSGVAGAIASPIKAGMEKGMNSANSFITKMEEVEASIKDAYQEQKEMTGNKAGRLLKKGATSKSLEKVAAGVELAPAALGKLKADLEKAEDKFDEFGKVASGVFKGLTKRDLRGMRRELDKTGDKGLKAGQKIRKIFAKGVVGALKGVKVAAKVATKAFAGMQKAANFAGKTFKMIGKGTIILGILQTIYDMFMKVMEAPATVVNNVMSMIGSVVKMVQTLLNSVVVRGINALLGLIPDWLLPDGAKKPQITEFTFAANIDETLVGLRDKGLGYLGLSMQDLQDKEAENKAATLLADKKDALREDFTSMAAELSNIAKGAAKVTGKARTTIVANALATLPIVGALEGAKAYDMLNEFNAAIKASGADVSSFGTVFEKAFKEKDIETLKGLTNAALTYNAGVASVKDTLNNLSTGLKDGARSSKSFLNTLLNNATAADNAALVLAQVPTEVDRVNEAFSHVGGLENYISMLDKLEERGAALAASQRNLAISTIQSGVNPSLIKADVSRKNAVIGSELKVDSMALKKDSLATTLVTETDPKKRIELAEEITLLEEALRLEKERLNVFKQQAGDISRIGLTLGESLSSNLQTAFQGLVDGSKNAKQAFSDMAVGILQSLAKIITEMLTVKLLQSTLGGTSFGSFLGITSSNRYGGVIDSSGKLPGYAVGGVAKGPSAGYPVELHGTEAVVPLPNGKSIPVQMTNGSGSTNNVVVNVSVDNQGNAQTSTESQSSQDAGRLGQLVSQAVQRELQNQKRSGGILNPYGAS